MENNNFIYNLDDKISLKKTAVYSVQHVIFFLASAVPMPIVVGIALGLNQSELADMLQRTFFLCGFVTLLQLILGHRFPIFDGPAGLWSGLLIVIAGSNLQLGESLEILRTDLEMGFLISGVFVMTLAIFGLIPALPQLFTPIVNGMLLLFMVVQISPSIVKGMTGVNSENQTIEPKSILVFFVTVTVALVINIYSKSFLKSVSTLMGALAGWTLAWILGMVRAIEASSYQIVSIPELFSWGKPTFNGGIVLTCLIASLIIISMDFASIAGMAETLGVCLEDKKFSRSIFVHGLAELLTGICPTDPLMPYISSAGVVSMTRVAARKPMLTASLFMIALGLIDPVGLLLAKMPVEVGYGVLIIVFAMVLSQGIRELQKQPIGNRESFVIGVPMLVGIGIMFLPQNVFRDFPRVIQYIFSNGLVDGVVLTIIMENLLLRKKSKMLTMK